MKLRFLVILLLFVVASTRAQYVPISENAEISILTVGPGTNLNDSFGHNGFRIRDENRGIDIIYDYGRYDFNTPNFYLKFAQGKLLYEIGFNNFDPFFAYYKRHDRWIEEQILNLNQSEKQALSNYLQNNAKPENKKYKYDFFYDNCATRIRDVLLEVVGDRLEYRDDHITKEYSFRELIQKNVVANSWGSFGMDVAIGAVTDRKAEPIEYQFLPEYVNKGAQNAVIQRASGEVPLVKESLSLYSAENTKVKYSFLGSPLFVFGGLGLLLLIITYKDFRNTTRSRITDAVIFFVTGTVGILLFLLWVATDHTATANNYNLLWASPLSLFFVLSIFRKVPKTWIRKYVFFLLLLLLLLVIHWLTGVQTFTIGLLPLLVALAIRYVYLMYYFKRREL